MPDQLDDLEFLARSFAARDHQARARKWSFMPGELYCPTCGGSRRMVVTPIHVPELNYSLEGKEFVAQFAPSLFRFRCVQDDTEFTALVYKGPDGPSLALFSTVRGGLTTPHTPAGVGFYLDQAYRARSASAYSAALAMYRAALEHLLYEHGYKATMLGPKLKQLLDAIEKGTAPAWAANLETDILQVLKDLGDGALHPNDGNVAVQSAFDAGFLNTVESTFAMLLYLIYEVPHGSKTRLETLRATAQLFKRPNQGTV